MPGDRVEIARAAARREEDAWSSTRSPMRAKPWAASWPRCSSQAKLLEGVAARFRPAGAAETHRSLRQFAYSGRQPGRRNDRGGAGRLNKIAIPQVQHPGRGHHVGDDFAMMREVLTRRFSRLLKEQGERNGGETGETPAWPDLVLIDGGQGQLSAVRGVLADLGLGDLPVGGGGQGAGPRCGARAFLHAGQALLHARRRAIRCSIISSGCAMRRIASPSAATGRGAARAHRGQSAGRDRRHRTVAQEGLAQRLRIGESGGAGQRRRSGGGRRRQRRPGAGDLRPLP